MIGLNVTSGKSLGGIEHLRQSVRDILTTRIGSRVMRRDYGSDLPNLVDAPMNRETFLKLYASTVKALEKWEPRLSINSVKVTSANPGAVELSITATYLPNGKTITLDGIQIK